MSRCDCGVFENCDVCLKLAERNDGPYTTEDYARHFTFPQEPDKLNVIIAKMVHEWHEKRVQKVLDEQN